MKLIFSNFFNGGLFAVIENQTVFVVFLFRRFILGFITVQICSVNFPGQNRKTKLELYRTVARKKNNLKLCIVKKLSNYKTTTGYLPYIQFKSIAQSRPNL